MYVRPGEFVQKEAAHNRSRENVMFLPSQSIVPGQIVAASTAVDGDKSFAAFNPTATDGTRVAAGISIYRVITTPGATVKSPIITREAVVKGKDLTWPPGITAAQQAEATEQLRTLGITIL